MGNTCSTIALEMRGDWCLGDLALALNYLEAAYVQSQRTRLVEIAVLLYLGASSFYLSAHRGDS